MLFSTPTQFAVLALVLVAGWFFGLASHPGGRKWRDRYSAEREAHALNRKQAEAHVAEQKTRTDELERENERLGTAARTSAAASTAPAFVSPVRQPAASPVAQPAASPLAQPAATPLAQTGATGAYPVTRTIRPSRGWFDWH